MNYQITSINNCIISFGPCPGGEHLLEQVLFYKRQGLNLIVSLLEEHEIEYLKLEYEGKFALAADIDFINFPIRDASVPSMASFSQTIETIFNQLYNLQQVYIHCRHGIGRSSLVVAGILIRSGIEFNDTLELIARKRGLKVPETLAQKKFIFSYYLSLKNK